MAMYSPYHDSTPAAGLLHSDICGSTPACGSPQLFAAYHVLLRLPMPRHPPCALISLTYIISDVIRIMLLFTLEEIHCLLLESSAFLRFQAKYAFNASQLAASVAHNAKLYPLPLTIIVIDI